MADLIPREMFAFPDMRNMFREFFNEPFFREAKEWADEGNLALDVSESKDGEVVVRASLPGFKKEDIHLTVRNGVLNIKAESKEEKEIKEEKYYRKERRWGSLTRSVALPGKLDEGSVKAELKDGVLTVKLRQSPEAQPKRIEVK
jgi:HSP20 family protein